MALHRPPRVLALHATLHAMAEQGFSRREVRAVLASERAMNELCKQVRATMTGDRKDYDPLEPSDGTETGNLHPRGRFRSTLAYLWCRRKEIEAHVVGLANELP
jgi:hypothetical protein